MIELIEKLHAKIGLHDVIQDMSGEVLKEFLEFRLSMIKEEVQELEDAIDESDAEEIVDALVDIMVFTLGTLDAYKVNSTKAFAEVMEANLAKNPGVKPGRPNPFGFPDLIKPEGWVAPSHEGNHGILPEIFED